VKRKARNQGQAGGALAMSVGEARPAARLELRHLRYFVAVAITSR
jgi:hypothetical protein